MKKYAKGRMAWGECHRSGKRVLLRDMVDDGYIPGLRVAKDWFEPKHPQENIIKIDDPVSLYKPAPEISIEPDYGVAAPPLTFPP